MNIRCYEDLIFWQKSIVLADEIYRITGKMPWYEEKGLVSQMQRAAVSISSNIAEGAERGNSFDYKFFLDVARGSAAELETQIKIAEKAYKNLDFLQAKGLLTEVHKMLNKAVRTIGARIREKRGLGF
ncbi:MAG: four helix bundle protein [Candidatus Gracilibacteria bacterium]|jgi:four helix bundle protein